MNVRFDGKLVAVTAQAEALALFLLPDFAGNITGQTIVVDGGVSVMGF